MTTKNKTILLVSKEYPPQLGGAGVIAHNIHKTLKDECQRVILISSNSKLWFLFMFLKLKYFSFIEKNKTIIINDVGAMYICGLALNRKEIKKSILWLHGSEKEKAFKTKSKIKKLIFFKEINLFVFKNVKFRVFVSNFLKKKFSDIVCLNGDSIVIPNSISEVFINNANSYNTKVQAIDENIRILTISRIIKDKGYFRFLEVFKMLPKNYSWTIVGDGPDLASLKNKIKDYHLSDRVNFLGKKSQKQLVPLYFSHNVFVLLSDFEESFGLVYIEALYCGLPVLANKKGALAEVLQSLSGVNFVSPSDNNETVYNTLISLLSNQNQNQNQISDKFGINKFSTNLNKII